MPSAYQYRVSVIIPAYNAADYVAEAIESVWHQNVDDLEIIVVNDGSSDGTAEVLAGYAGDRVQIITTANQGVARARNEGLDRAQGEFIAFLDADDRWRPEKLRRELALMDAEPEVGTIFSNFVRFEESGRLYPDQFQFCPELDALDVVATRGGDGFRLVEPGFIALVNFGEVPGYTQAMMFRRSVIEDLRFRYPLDWNRNYQYLEDMDFCLRCFRRSAVAFIKDPLVDVRRHGENLTSDYKKIAAAKLATFKALAEENLAPEEQRALVNRTGRQWVAVGRYSAQSRHPLKALNAFGHAAAHGRWKSAIGGLARMPADMVKGLN